MTPRHALGALLHLVGLTTAILIALHATPEYELAWTLLALSSTFVCIYGLTVLLR